MYTMTSLLYESPGSMIWRVPATPDITNKGGPLMPETILVVSSSPEGRAYWEALLSDQKYEVIAKGTIEAAVLACQRSHPDLILFSGSVPDLQNDNFLRQLKDDPRNRLTPVVFLDYSTGQIDFPKAFEAEADEIWAESLPYQEVLSRLKYLLERKFALERQTERSILSLAQAMDAREPGQRHHSQRVANNAVRLGEGLHLGEDDLSVLRIAGIVHDIGKATVPDEILQKFGPLTGQEAWLLQQHPALGEEICAPCKSFRRILPLIRHHHERMDGSGYPDQIKGSEISLGEQILQLVEFYDSLITEQYFHCSISLPTALELLYEEADRGRFDQELVNCFGYLLVGEETSKSLRRKVRNRSSLLAG
jgi:putative two-component system response regulator